MPHSTLCELFQATAAEGGDRPALAMPGHRGYTWAEYADVVRRLAPVFADLGVRPGEAVPISLGPCPEFHLVDTALLHAGAVPFSLQDRDTVQHDLERVRRSQARMIVTDRARLEQVREVAARAGGLTIVVVDGKGATDTELALDDLVARRSETDFDTLWRAVDAEDIATLIFTSGTTGAPKAVQLSHRAFTVSEQSTHALAPFSTYGDVLSYLPLTHTAERFMSHYASMAYGATIHSVPDPATLYDDILRVRPTRFFGIPRVYEKLADRAHAIVDANPELAAAVETSRTRVREVQARRTPSPELAKEADEALATLAGVRAALGLERAEYLGVATAPSSAAMLEFFLALGLNVSDIWGMSEIIMCTLNPPHDIRLGSVGCFLHGVEGRIAPDGEIQVRGPNAFSGYLADPGRTAELMDADGWISTGDLGAIEDGYLRIRGRKKEMLITSTGKNIAPATIEAALKDSSPLVEHAIAIADGRRYVTAVIALEPDQLSAFAAEHGLSGTFGELAASAEVRAALEAAVADANATLAGAETVRAFWVSAAAWSPSSDELTSTSKLRRDVIARKYATEIERLYI